MKVDCYELYCSNCNPSRWFKIYYTDVKIMVSLKTDEYVFKAICPNCNNEIENRRKAF